MTQINFPELEQEILEFWEKEKIFTKSLEKDSPKGEFVFYEGPPTANGRPGIHHVLARAFKDLIPRYKTMQGFHVNRKAGWDTHGLPVELAVEKHLGISGKPQIEALQSSVAESIKFFNAKCQESVWQYKEEWEKLTRRMGFWIDMDKPYITYTNDYIETLWWIIKQVHDKQLLYLGHKVVPHCPRCGTALSSHEVAQGYREVKDESVYIKFRIKNDEVRIKGEDNSDVPLYILSWTTTPWTLPGNVALAIGNDFDYVKIRIKNDELRIKEDLIIAKARLNILGQTEFEILEEFKGSELVGVEYEPLFPGAISETVENYKNAYKIYPADFVTTEDGTGVVHTAVMYGEDDYNLGEAVGLPKVHTVNENGNFSFQIQNSKFKILEILQNRFVKDSETEKIIINYLQEQKLLFGQESYQHDYPFCWRCDTPLLYYAKDSWFIKMSSLREQLKTNNQNINWLPDHIKFGRFGEWLEGVKDWAISRERYWGTPLPIWKCQANQNKELRIKNQVECRSIKVIGSFDELEKLSGQKITDAHRPFVDDIKIKCDQCGGEMVRDTAVLDCWFDSGAMPFAQIHYPFDNKDLIDNKKWYPADFICEAIDQTRGWFYTLLAVATLLDQESPYKNVICLGHINDKHGKKMSKSKGNIVDPWEIMNSYGADALRWHFYTINQPGEPKNFDPQQVEEVLKKNWLILWNVFSFYSLYKPAVKTVPTEPSPDLLDQWILTYLREVTRIVTNYLDNYDITSAARMLSDFINDLSTWYVRRSRDRFKAGGETQAQAVKTLGFVLLELTKLLAPFTPFLAEKIYQELIKDCPVKENEFAFSVHLSAWPQVNEKTAAETEMLQTMNQVRDIVTQALALRAEAKIKVRQPLAELFIKQKDFSEQYLEILRQEVNVINVSLGASEIKLNTTIDENLAKAGLVRELVRTVNNLRKQAGLTITDKIILYIDVSNQLEQSIAEVEEMINSSTLSKQIVFAHKDNLDSKEIKFAEEKIWLGIEKT